MRYHEQFGELILYCPLSIRMMEGHRVCRNGKAFEKRPNKIYMCRKVAVDTSAGNHHASPKLMEAFRRNESTEPLSASWNGFYALCNVITCEIVRRNI